MDDETNSNEGEAPRVGGTLQDRAEERAEELPVPLSVFAASLSPRTVPLLRGGRPVVFKGRHVMTATAGHADQIWLKLLKINHAFEKHTPAEWNALIDTYRDQPAYPGVVKGFA